MYVWRVCKICDAGQLWVYATANADTGPETHWNWDRDGCTLHGYCSNCHGNQDWARKMNLLQLLHMWNNSDTVNHNCTTVSLLRLHMRIVQEKNSRKSLGPNGLHLTLKYIISTVFYPYNTFPPPGHLLLFLAEMLKSPKSDLSLSWLFCTVPSLLVHQSFDSFMYRKLSLRGLFCNKCSPGAFAALNG